MEVTPRIVRIRMGTLQEDFVGKSVGNVANLDVRSRPPGAVRDRGSLASHLSTSEKEKI